MAPNNNNKNKDNYIVMVDSSLEVRETEEIARASVEDFEATLPDEADIEQILENAEKRNERN